MLYRYKIKFWSDLDRKEIKEKGFVIGASYEEATANLTDLFTDLEGYCSITEISLSEIDACDGSGCKLLTDFAIEEIWRGETSKNVK